MNQLTENSLYTTPAEKEELLKDKERVANAFFINFLGTLGLFAISSTRGVMKTYFPDDGKLQLVNIGDANKDTSLSVKLYSDVGGLKPGTVNKITRLLFKLKSRAITSKNFDENFIREIVGEIQYLSHRPHPLILNVVKQFEAGTASIKQVAKAFFQLVKTRKKDFLPVAQEFYAIARQYLIYLKDIPEIGSVSSTDDAVSTSVQTAVPHAVQGTATVEPVSSVVNQKAKADKIQTVAKIETVKDEDFYLMLWKATSGREVSKLLKERGYDSFTPELMQKACDYLLPKDKNESRIDMVMKSMPKVEEFLKGFGQAMAKDPNQKDRLGLVLLYKASLSKTTDEILQILTTSRTHIRRFFSNILKVENLNGTKVVDLRWNTYYTMLNELQRKIVSAGPSDDIDGMFKMFYSDMDKLTSLINGLPWHSDYASEFPKDSTLSEKEKIKYLVAVASDLRLEIGGAVRKLIELLKANGISYREVQKDYFTKSYNIPKYDNLFPGSKECIDSWYKSTKQKLLSFGEIDFYSEIAKDWEKGLEVAIEKNIKNIPETEDNDKVAEKIFTRIIQLLSGNDDVELLIRVLTIFSDSPGSIATDRVEIIANTVWALIAEYLRKEIEQGKFNFNKLSEAYRASLIASMHSLIRYGFIKTNMAFDDEQWADYIGLMKASFKNNDLKKDLLDYALKQGVIEIEKVLPYVNMDWGGLVRYILSDIDKNLTHGATKVLIDYRSSQYMKDKDYKELAFGLSKFYFLELCASHKIDPSKYVSYDFVKYHIEDVLFNSSNSIKPHKYVKDLLQYLKEKDRLEVYKGLENKMFYLSPFKKKPTIDSDIYDKLRFIFGENKTKEFLNSLDQEKKKALLDQYPEVFFEDMTADSINETLSSYLRDIDSGIYIANKHSTIQGIIKRADEISLENVRKVVDVYSRYDRNLNPSVRREFEQLHYSAFDILYKKNEKVADDVFMQMPLQERRALVKYLTEERYMEKALSDIQGDNVLIKPLTPVTTERLRDILKYNDVKTPSSPRVNKDDTLIEVMAKKVEVPPVEELHVNLDDLSEEQLERMSVEYDTFNRYAHGNIALKFIRSFSVNVPIQEEGFKNWLRKMEEEGTDPKIMKPVFHGTGSIGASMILRYGFKVIKSDDPAVVGRMLGDGIYFSTVIDKVAQYVSDEGYNRHIGNQGYIFEMESSLGKHRRDYRCAGTGTPQDEYSVVSPEWAVFNPNEQIRIYKAYLVEVINKYEMKKLKKKHLGENESIMVNIKSFKQFLHEGTGDTPHCITYIFMDGTIPVDRNKVVDFEDFDAKKFGRNVRLDWTASGPAVMIYNTRETATYAVRYTREFMQEMKDEFLKYLKLLNGKK